MEKTQKEIIKEICEEFECTQKELAKRFGFSYGAVCKWTNGQNEIPEYFFKSVQFARDVKKFSEELKEKYKDK